MRITRDSPQRGVLRAGACGDPGTGVASTIGPDLHGASGVWGAAHGLGDEGRRTGGKPQMRAAVVAGDGIGSGVSEAAAEAAGRRGGPFSLFIAGRKDRAAWATDITYIALARGWAYLVAILEWYSRYVLAWGVSGSRESDFCVRARPSAGDHEQRSGGGVLQRGLGGGGAGDRGADQSGWARASVGQCDGGAVVADGQTRARVSARLPGDTGAARWAGRIFSVLQ